MKIGKLMQYLSASDRDKIIDIIADRADWISSQVYTGKDIERHIDTAVSILNRAVPEIECSRIDRYDRLIGAIHGADEPKSSHFDMVQQGAEPPLEGLNRLTSGEMAMYAERVRAGEKIETQINGSLHVSGNEFTDALGLTPLAVKAESVTIEGRYFKLGPAKDVH